MVSYNDTILKLYGRHGREGEKNMYEYVAKSEYAPIRQELEKIINIVQQEMRKKHKITFQFRLIGSGKRHLITRIRGGNKGYDFDYKPPCPHTWHHHK